MIELKDSDITQILPGYLEDQPETQAIAYAIKKQIDKIIQWTEKTSLYAAVDKADERLLDVMAIDLNAPYYDFGAEIEVKRGYVKSALAWYRYAGTPKAVEELVKTAFGEGEVIEWFDYEGSPYYFKVRTELPITQESFDLLSKMLSKVKNVRSHLDKIELLRTLNQDIKFGGWTRSITKAPAIKEENG